MVWPPQQVSMACVYISFISSFLYYLDRYQDVPRQNMALTCGLLELLRCRKSSKHWPQILLF